MAFLPFNSINTAEGTLQPVTNQQDNKGITNLRKRYAFRIGDCLERRILCEDNEEGPFFKTKEGGLTEKCRVNQYGA